jgi:hypothetical protein
MLRVGVPKPMKGAPPGSLRFSVEARLEGRPFTSFALDVEQGDLLSGEAEWKDGQADLTFAGIEWPRLPGLSSCGPLCREAARIHPAERAPHEGERPSGSGLDPGGLERRSAVRRDNEAYDRLYLRPLRYACTACSIAGTARRLGQVLRGRGTGPRAGNYQHRRSPPDARRSVRRRRSPSCGAGRSPRTANVDRTPQN